MREDVKKAIQDFEIKTFGNFKNIEKAENLLSNDEKVLYVAPTNIVVTSINTKKKEKSPGVIFLTDKRVLFSFNILFSSQTEVFSLDEIRSINCYGNSLLGGHVEIHTIVKTFDFLVSYKNDMLQKIRQTFENAKKSYEFF
ncbi:MAG: PH domain-containing protein [Anaerovoracaceae bacterium]